MATVNTFPLETTPLATVLQSLNFALYNAVSTTSLAIGTGAKAFTIQAGKDFQPGMFVIAPSDADPDNYMGGQVVSYVGTTLTVDVTAVGGSGTHADWTILVSGPPGATGTQGEPGEQGPPGQDGLGTGDVVGPASSTDGRLAFFSGTTGKLLKQATNLVEGFTATSFSAGTKSSGTFTPDPTQGNIQHYVNGGAHTLAPPSSPCTMIIECTNASAGALTTSGFSIVSGDTYSATGTKKHIFYITKTNSYSQLHVQYVTGT